MRLTLHSDYALRLLMLLALEPTVTHTAESISRRYAISHNHLTKIVQTLVQKGFVESQRGRGGGVRLARPATAINLGQVIRATEDNFDIVECFASEKQGCLIAPACGLRDPLQQALAAFLAVLDRYSLADLIGNPAASRRLRRLLAV